MIYIKSILVWLHLAVTTLLLFPILFVVTFLTLPFDFKRKVPHFFSNLWCKLLVATNPMINVLLHYESKMTRDRTYIIATNHQSFADILVLGCLGMQYKWIAKESIFKVPIFGFAMKIAGYICLKRGDKESTVKCMHKAKYWLSEDISIMISPEGTRSKDGGIGPFKSGVARLALETGTWILPVSIYGTREIIPKGTWKFTKPAKVKGYIGCPIDPNKYLKDDIDGLKNEVRRVIVRNFEKIRGN